VRAGGEKTTQSQPHVAGSRDCTNQSPIPGATQYFMVQHKNLKKGSGRHRVATTEVNATARTRRHLSVCHHMGRSSLAQSVSSPIRLQIWWSTAEIILGLAPLYCEVNRFGQDKHKMWA